MTQCPSCNYRRQPHDAGAHAGICPSCGIAYTKWRAHSLRASQPPRSPSDASHDDEAFLSRLRLQLLEIPEQVDPLAFWGRAATLGALALWAGWFLLHGIDWEVIGGSFLHNANLAFHEFGHLFFRPFGQFMTILGGSLFQVLMPLALMLVFVIRQRDNFAAAAALWWSGQNFVDVSPYIRDAEYRLLPLVGGSGEESHDWGNLLTMLDAVDSCYALARTSFATGALLMLLGLGWGAWLLLLQHARIQSAAAN